MRNPRPWQRARAHLLDVSRLASRAGHGVDTGVDRVERAYLRHLLSLDTPLFGLAATRPGFVLLDRAGLAALVARFDGATPWGRADLFGRATWRNRPARARAEADLRRLAVDRCPPWRLGAMLRRRLPEGSAYFSTGHANLSERVFAAVHDVAGARVAVLVHDTIPLDHPAFARADTPAKFALRLRAVGAHADLVIYNSAASAAAAEAHFARWGRVPPGCVAHLGVAAPCPDPAAVPADLPRDRPYFLCLGTIEPRKNHALLLDVWDRLMAGPAPAPRLMVLGARGWASHGLLARLDATTARGDTVIERAGLADGAIAALMAGAAGLLFPSLAEGYGLPPLEAAALGVPAVCTDLPVYREVLGECAVYLPGDDSYSWERAVHALAGRARAPARRAPPTLPTLPTWAAHFDTVLGQG